MPEDVTLNDGAEEFLDHAMDVFGVEAEVFEERIGGSVMVLEKRLTDGPLTLMTAGVSRLPTDTGERIELAVEVVREQIGAAFAALDLVCNQIALSARVPPIQAPWRNGGPFLSRTKMTSIVLTASRWGPVFDDVVGASGAVRGHVRTVRLLSDREADVVQDEDWDALVARVGSVDNLLDVKRKGKVH